MLPDDERLDMLGSTDAIIRAGAAHSFFNAELSAAARTALLAVAKSDPDPEVRGRAWESLADAAQDTSIRDALVAVLSDPSKSIAERGGAAVGLHMVADRDDVRMGIEALYELNGKARAKALETMWRSLWPSYAKYFPPNLDDTRPEILRPALRGAGYFRLTRHADKIATFFDREEPYSNLREDALFAYALAMPGETTRGRVRGMLRKLDGLAGLTSYETELVEFALDERLRLSGLDPVFAAEEGAMTRRRRLPLTLSAPSPKKAGRNDPCPVWEWKEIQKVLWGEVTLIQSLAERLWEGSHVEGTSTRSICARFRQTKEPLYTEIVRRYRLTVRTEPSQGLNTGSIPVSATKESITYRLLAHACSHIFGVCDQRLAACGWPYRVDRNPGNPISFPAIEFPRRLAWCQPCSSLRDRDNIPLEQ